ncbi:MAG: S8 family peptidase [Pseudomonadota bacterium]
MHRQKLLCTAVLAAGVLSALGIAPGFAAELRTSRHPIEGRYIVVLKENVARLSSERSSSPRVADVAREVVGAHRARLLRSYDRALRGFVVEANDDTLAKLLADPRVAYVEEDGMAFPNPTQSGATWGIDRVDQPNLPLSGTYTYDTTASNVHAYVIDSGVLGTHTEFSGRMGNGYTAIFDGQGTSDCNGHGTHVAGTLGGTTWGIAKGVTIHPVRVFGCSGGSPWSTIIAGIDWVAANHVKPAVANMSLGGGGNTSVDAATNTLINAGVTVVVAAGNQGADACGYSPARVANAITVGSTQSNDARSWFSNHGSCLDMFAPGSGITSAWWTSTTASAALDGTSMASPHVAGAAALHLAGNPNATPSQVASALVNKASLNKVSDARAGSPNRLLYTLTPTAQPPVITGIYCSGQGSGYCSVSYTSSTPVSVTWTGASGPGYGDYYWGVCSFVGYWASVAVSVQNSVGTTNGYQDVFCSGGYDP